MRTYTLHVADGAEPGDPEALDEAVLVRDGFSGAAFAFSFVWFLYHRLWLAALLVGLGLLVLQVLLALTGAGGGARTLAGVLYAFLVGLEANSLRRWTLERDGRSAIDLVRARDRDEAEAKAYRRWLEADPLEPAPPQPSPAAASPARSPTAKPAPSPAVQRRLERAEPVIGLFPDAERR